MAKKRPVINSDSDVSGGSDLDEELLSLASAAKRAKPPVTAASLSESDSSSDTGSDDEWALDGDETGKKKGKSQKPKATSSKEPKKKASINSSEVEASGEEVKQAVTQKTSDSDVSSFGGESSSDESLKFDDGLDENLIGDEEDRKRLDQMTEAEREQEMYNRYLKRDALKARFEVKQRLRRLKREKEKQEMQKKEDEDLRQKGRRKVNEDKTKSRAMDELKAKRTADKQKKAEAEQVQQQKEPLKASDIYSDSDEESSSAEETPPSNNVASEDEAGEKTIQDLKTVAPKHITTLDEINKIKLSRFRLEKWVHMPYFEAAVKGCFVRVGIGAHEGKMVYRICEITGVQETPKVYSLGSTKTNKGLKLRHGVQERTFRMEYVSNSSFTDSEFQKWKTELEKRGSNLPTVASIQKKTKELDQYKNKALEEEDIDKILMEKAKFRRGPKNYAMSKSKLMREKEVAEQEGDTDKVSSIVKQLEELEERAEELDKQRTKSLSAISYINERNRQGNVLRAEQALKEEMAGEKHKEDPFTRRKCQPTLVSINKDAPDLFTKHTASKEDTKKAGMTSGTAHGEETKEELKEAQADLLPPLGEMPKCGVNDLFSAHDFDIQIDLPTASAVSSGVSATPKSIPLSRGDAPRRSLNLDDYKKRRGLI